MKGTGNHANQRRGDRHPNAKLTWTMVQSMRRLAKEGANIAAMAKQAGVNASVAWKAIHGATWRHET